MKRILTWLFAPQTLPVVWWKVILWWEVRRIAFNLFVTIYGVFCLLVFFWAITSSGQLELDEDAVEPLTLLFAPILANLGYTLGWLVEISIRLLQPAIGPNFGPQLYKLGLGFSFLVISAPAVLWVGYLFLQLVGVLT
jgi:hypothetical protein